jgi:hypothetical protein
MGVRKCATAQALMQDGGMPMDYFLDQLDPNDPNFSVSEQLRDYVCSPARNFAIMISSPWGAGKTTYVKSFIKKINPVKRKVVYVSLFGVHSEESMYWKIIAAINPVIYSKLSKFIAGKVKDTTTSTLSAYAKITTGANINFDFNVPPTLLFNPSSADIFVFDDLERSEIDLVSVFGVFNRLLENHNKHVIIISNEEELPDSFCKNGAYYKQKEKIIGKTLSINTPINCALRDYMIELEVFDNPESEIFQIIFKDISRLFHQSGFQNLRVLKFGALGIGNILSKLDEDIYENRESVLELIGVFFIFLIETFSNKITPSDIYKRNSIVFSTIPDDTGISSAKNKYSNYLGSPIVDSKYIEACCSGSHINFVEFNQHLRNNSYFSPHNYGPAIPSVIYEYYKYPTNIVSEQLNLLSKDLNEHRVSGIMDILRCYDLAEYINSENITGHTFLGACDSYNEYIKNNPGVVRDPLNFEMSKLCEQEFAGTFLRISDPVFTKAMRDLKSIINEDVIPFYRSKNIEIMLSNLERNIFDFIKIIAQPNSEITCSMNEIFSHIDVEKFSHIFLKKTFIDQKHVLSAIVKRYDGVYGDRIKNSESDFLQSFSDIILGNIEGYDNIHQSQIRKLLATLIRR